ncbi:hypothetical protein U9M48_039464 [Paspalum notatum var. saurae]|uniref:Uncharacterized protein n=1 Tax=Paspalum notatum var. saurae TaxID=547442 RepID=A0AAQ3UQB9_PASNO
MGRAGAVSSGSIYSLQGAGSGEMIAWSKRTTRKSPTLSAFVVAALGACIPVSRLGPLQTAAPWGADHQVLGYGGAGDALYADHLRRSSSLSDGKAAAAWSFSLNDDTGNEELTQQLPLVEEPEDQEPVNPEQEEYPQAAPDFATEEANPSE